MGRNPITLNTFLFWLARSVIHEVCGDQFSRRPYYHYHVQPFHLGDGRVTMRFFVGRVMDGKAVDGFYK